MKPRRVYPAELKRKVLQEYYTTEISQGEIERKYDIAMIRIMLNRLTR